MNTRVACVPSVTAFHEGTKMTRRARRIGACLVTVVVFFGVVSTASAQVFTGRVDVTIEDATGGRLPGVTVDLTGPINQTQIADAQGQAHFLNLPVGTYAVKAALSGFNTYANSTVQVVSGGSTPLSVKLGVAGTSESIIVTAASPIIDVKRETTTTNVTLDELQNIPSARDPWAVMQTVPTVYMDRVNVGGSESGQQSNYNAKGAKDTDNTWSIDGVPVTDMGATGASAFYYDFDSFQEMAVTTGGAEAQNPTGGVQLNMVLKKGVNAPHGDLRTYFENQKLQGVNISPSLAEALGNTTGKGNRTDRYFDRGFDLGGPLLRDRVWIWGTMAQTNIKLLTLTGDLDETIFKNYALKVDGEVTKGVRGNFTFYENNKIKNGRDVGPTRPPETAWNQTGPTKYYKGGGDFVVGNRLYATAKVAKVDGGFLLAPVGGLDKDYYIDDGGVAHNTFYQYQSTRPQNYIGGDASFFSGRHEIKAGAAWRSTPVDTQQIWPASHIIATWLTYPTLSVQVARNYRAATDAKYLNGFVTDTISLNRVTLTGGVRFDHQESSLGSASVAGVDGFPILPALNAPAVAGVYKWDNVTPRLGISFAVDRTRKTLVRASYAMFASQLPGDEAKFISPIQYSYAYYNAVDRNGDGIAQLSEILFNQGLVSSTGFDPNNPTRLSTVNKVDPAVKAPLTHELLVGVDRELTPNLGVSATFTYRWMIDPLWDLPTGVRRSDYVQTGTISGTNSEVGTYSVPIYALKASAVPDPNGQTETNRQGYHQRYWGLEFSATKRLANRWMARFGFSTNDWREYFDDPSLSIVDPTKAPAAKLPARPYAGPQVNGGLVVRQSGGSGKSNIFLVAPKYQLVANGSFEARWGINFAANLVARQGYAEPFFRSNVSTGDPLGRKEVLLVNNVDDFRLPAVTSLDARVEKRFKFGSSYLALDFDVFNLLNSGTVLGRQYDEQLTGPTGFGNVLEIMNPRIARLGVRFTF
jgi:Carboxypeptidase regulatory-like domain/TonB-dependent Receptor Plug Domain